MLVWASDGSRLIRHMTSSAEICSHGLEFYLRVVGYQMCSMLCLALLATQAADARMVQVLEESTGVRAAAVHESDSHRETDVHFPELSGFTNDV